jgi:hypothetical protein
VGFKTAAAEKLLASTLDARSVNHTAAVKILCFSVGIVME